MTADEFRAIALSLPDTAESSHMDHPDFRTGGKIFATLGYPDHEWGMVSLALDDQARFSQAEPDVFAPVKNAWGRAGATQVCLRLARNTSVRAALRAAWEYRVRKNSPATGRKPARKARTPKSSGEK
jgi:hypothetical protein